MIYGHLLCVYKTIKRNNELLRLILKSERNQFRSLMNYNVIKKTKCENIDIFVQNKNKTIWMLSYLHGRYYRKRKRKIFPMITYCAVCNKQQRKNEMKSKRFKKCSGCKLTYYCGSKCHKIDWNIRGHRNICSKLIASTS